MTVKYTTALIRPPSCSSSHLKLLPFPSNAAEKKRKKNPKQGVCLCYLQAESFPSTGCSDKSLKSFQLTQNVAAHVLTRTTTSDHISLMPAAPDWLQVKPGAGSIKLLLPLRSGPLTPPPPPPHLQDSPLKHLMLEDPATSLTY